MPRLSDVDLKDVMCRLTMEKLLEVNPQEWKKEAEGIEQFYNQFGNRLPDVLKQHLQKLKAGSEKGWRAYYDRAHPIHEREGSFHAEIRPVKITDLTLRDGINRSLPRA